jgi:hypothetical protein
LEIPFAKLHNCARGEYPFRGFLYNPSKRTNRSSSPYRNFLHGCSFSPGSNWEGREIILPLDLTVPPFSLQSADIEYRYQMPVNSSCAAKPTPPSEMIRVPTVLIPIVHHLSKLYRQGHTIALLQGLEELIAQFDSSMVVAATTMLKTTQGSS